MICFKVIFLLAFNFVLATHYQNCRLSYRFANICKQYKFDKTCVPWDLQHCSAPKRTLNEYKCPVFSCVSFNTMKYILVFISNKSRDRDSWNFNLWVHYWLSFSILIIKQLLMKYLTQRNSLVLKLFISDIQLFRPNIIKLILT